METGYHKLYRQVKESDDYLEVSAEFKPILLEAIKLLYVDFNELQKQRDMTGNYGIEYYTVHEDSKYSDRHVQMFSNSDRRDIVYESWISEQRWDNLFEQELEYPMPGPNLHSIRRFRLGTKCEIIYESNN